MTNPEFHDRELPPKERKRIAKGAIEDALFNLEMADTEDSSLVTPLWAINSDYDIDAPHPDDLIQKPWEVDGQSFDDIIERKRQEEAARGIEEWGEGQFLDLDNLDDDA